MRTSIIMLLVLIATVCNAQVYIKKAAKDYDFRDSTFMWLTSRAQLDSAHQLFDKGVEYQVVIDKDSLITFVSTIDKKFISPEKLRVGMKYADIPVSSIVYKDSLSTGWFKKIKLKSDWYALFDNAKPLKKSSLIVGFYQQ